jgi:thiosulfate oxidation carrier complex protein SoxZ
MHTGRAKDENGDLIPAQFIQDIRCWRNKEEVLTIKCGTATSRNPYFSFLLAGGAVDDTITIRWVDNVGEKGIVETKVQ